MTMLATLNMLNSRSKSLSAGQAAAAKGFRQREASFFRGDFVTRRQLCRISVYCQEVLRFQLRIVSKNLLLRCSARKPFKDLLDSNPVASDARFPESHSRINCYAFQ